MLDGETVEVPTAAAVESAAVATEAAAAVASSEANNASAAAAVAEHAAAEVIAEIEEDEEWLEKHLLEITGQIQLLRTEMTAINQSLMATLSQQAELIRSMTEKVIALSTPAISSVENPTPATAVVENVAVAPEAAAPEAENHHAKKFRKI